VRLEDCMWILYVWVQREFDVCSVSICESTGMTSMYVWCLISLSVSHFRSISVALSSATLSRTHSLCVSLFLLFIYLWCMCVSRLSIDLLKYSIIWWGNTNWEWMQSIMWVCEVMCAQYSCLYTNVMYMSIVYVFWLDVIGIIASILQCVITCALCSVRMAGLLLYMHLTIINLTQWSVLWKNTTLTWISPARYDVCCLLIIFCLDTPLKFVHWLCGIVWMDDKCFWQYEFYCMCCLRSKW